MRFLGAFLTVWVWVIGGLFAFPILLGASGHPVLAWSCFALAITSILAAIIAADA